MADAKVYTSPKATWRSYGLAWMLPDGRRWACDAKEWSVFRLDDENAQAIWLSVSLEAEDGYTECRVTEACDGLICVATENEGSLNDAVGEWLEEIGVEPDESFWMKVESE
jgi:hypothetical protein